MKFRHYLETITGVELYPLISLAIFFLFFLALLVYVIRADKKEVFEMKSLPLDNETDTPNPLNNAPK